MLELNTGSVPFSISSQVHREMDSSILEASVPVKSRDCGVKHQGPIGQERTQFSGAVHA